MARVAVQLTNFTGGELSPRLDGRNDLQKYSTGCKTLENMIIFPHGSAARRSGTQFVAEVKDSTKETRLIPFEFSTTQTYILEFGNQYIRFFKDNGQILSSGSPYEISSPYLEAELFDIKFAQSADVMYICHPNHPAKKFQLEKLQALVTGINQGQLELGRLETQKHVLLHQIKEVHDELGKFKSELKEEYGDISVNVQDGTYEEISSEDASDKKD